MDRLKVLVVDDEQGMREGVRRALAELEIEVAQTRERFGLELRVAATGQEGLDLISSWEPDLLLLDYKLPDISGLDILRSLASEDRDLLTIMITAYATLQTAITATRRGAFDFLAKPYNPGELRAVVSKAAQHLLLQRRARALAEERQRVRFDFVRVLAHELIIHGHPGAFALFPTVGALYLLASVPLAVATRGVPYVIVHRGETDQDDHPAVTLRLDGDVGEIFPAAVDEALGRLGGS